MYQSEQVTELFSALSKAQSEMKALPFDKKNPHFGNEYASLAATQEGARMPLSKNGLALIQSVQTEGDDYFVETRIIHSSGQWIGSKLKLLIFKKDMQGIGSATTYAKRYAAQAILGLSGDEDDDGNAAAIPKATPPKAPIRNYAPKQEHPPQTFPPEDFDQSEKKTISEAQAKRLHALKSLAKWQDTELKGILATVYAIESTKDLSFKDYTELCGVLEMKMTPQDAAERLLGKQ